MSTIENATAWLHDSAWPHWLRHGIDYDAQAFHEYLAHDGSGCAADFRRLRVVTRQIIVFSEAARLGIEGASAAVDIGLRYLERYAGRPETGFAWRFDLEGRIIDDRRDLYDHAFTLLALANAALALPQRRTVLREVALALDTYLQSMFRHPSGGYAEGVPPALPRRQNPHMHLFEAYLMTYEVFGDGLFLQRGDELATLMLERLFQWPESALPEYFDDTLVPIRERGHFVVEPGHHAEWVWLLNWHRRLSGKGYPRREEALTALMRFLDAYGVNATTGGLVDELWSDGTVKSGSSRLWPQTEYLKAELLRSDRDEARIARVLAALMAYVEAAPAGLWHERHTEEGGFSKEPSPASSLYHLTGAIMFASRMSSHVVD
jgi:mannose-6-phosphate isomerase